MSADIVTTVLLGASSYDLTDLGTVKDELRIPGSDIANDPFLKRAITQASATVANYCNRTFPIETVRDVIYRLRGTYLWTDRGGPRPLQLSRWPILPALVSLAAASDVAAGAVVPLTDTSALSVGMPVWGVPNIPDDAFVKAITADVSVTLSAPVLIDLPAGTTLNFGPRVSTVNGLGVVRDLLLGTDYTIDPDRGWLIRLNHITGYPRAWGGEITIARYAAGYAPIPPDVVDALLRVITGRFSGRGRDPFLKSIDQPVVGTQTFWVGNLPGKTAALSDEIEDMLDSYRVPMFR